MAVLILAASTALQYLAAFLAARLIAVTRHKTAWLLIASGLLLMGVRRTITLVHILQTDSSWRADPTAEWVALAISLLMVLGVSRIGQLFRDLKNSTGHLLRSESLLQGIINHTPAAIYVKDKQDRYLLCNTLAAARSGRSPSELIGKTDEELPPTGQVPTAAAKAPTDFTELEEQHAHPDGAVHHYLRTEFPLLDHNGTPYAVCTMSRDVTQRVRDNETRQQFEAQLQEAERLKSLGALAGGVAHDFNNLLAVIMGGTELALMDTPPGTKAQEDLEKVQTACDSAASLCRQLLAYTGRARREVETLELSELVRNMTHLMETSISKKAILQYDLAPDLPPIGADSGQLQQVLLNLLTNASEAIGDRGGTIRVSTKCLEIDGETKLDLHEDRALPPKRYVVLEVSDDGCGVDNQSRTRLFDPFFTTKFTGRGLGLASVAGIVRSHGGGILLESTEGKGSTFRVYFPCVTGVRVSRRPQVSHIPARVRQATLLLVEDEELVQRVGRDLLERAGFQVITANNGREAVELFSRKHDRVDLVLLDLTMPEMDGKETFTQLRRIDPAVKVILMSGYDATHRANELGDEELSGFVPKPYRAQQLLAAVDQALRTPLERHSHDKLGHPDEELATDRSQAHSS